MLKITTKAFLLIGLLLTQCQAKSFDGIAGDLEKAVIGLGAVAAVGGVCLGAAGTFGAIGTYKLITSENATKNFLGYTILGVTGVITSVISYTVCKKLKENNKNNYPSR